MWNASPPASPCARCAPRTGGPGQNATKAELLRAQAPEPYLAQIFSHLQPPAGCTDLLRRAIAEEPAALVRDGGVIASGFDTELDELRAIQTNCDSFLLELETRESAHRHPQPAGAVQQGARLLY